MAVSNFKFSVSTLKNMQYRHLNREEIGFTIEDHLEPIEAKHVADYIQATRDFNPLYKEDSTVVPPFFATRLIWDHIKQVLVNPNLHLNFFRMVHANQSVIWHKQIHTHDKIRVKMSISDIIETPAGEMLQLSGTVFTNDEPAAEAVAGLIIRGPRRNRKRISEPPFKGKKLFQKTIQTHKGQNLEYARASTDTSFIHVNDFLARLTGLPGAIMHGVCIMAMVCSSFTAEILDNDISQLRGISNRFNNPTMPGEALTMTCYEGSKKGSCVFTLINEAGKEIFKNGIIQYQA